jgi:predicted acyltransferase
MRRIAWSRISNSHVIVIARSELYVRELQHLSDSFPTVTAKHRSCEPRRGPLRFGLRRFDEEAAMAKDVRSSTDAAAKPLPRPAREERVRPGPSPPRRRRLEPSHGTTKVSPVPTTDRVVSVDALRGFSMFWILGADTMAISLNEMLADKGPLASKVGSVIGTQFKHPEWEGFHFYDLIFPLFIFVTGVAIVFSLTRLVEHEGMVAAHLRVLRRSALLFALGVICYGGLSETWGDVRLGGVLQRIALCYLFASLLFLNLRLPGLVTAFVAFLVGYWLLVALIPVPGVGAGSFARDANLANWIDARYLPGRKLEGTWDPEGLLSTLPAIGTCLLGVFGGLLLKDARLTPAQKSLGLIVAGAAMVAVGCLWGLQFPVIKWIWTSSFVLVTGGLSAMLLGAFHQIIDAWGRKAWASVFIWIGASAITLYVINMIIGFERIAVRLVGGDLGRLFDQYLSQGAGRFLAHAVGLMLAAALAYFLYRRKIFLRV